MICVLATGDIWAARPFVTDDARLTTEGSCQLESWTRMYQDSTEFWALPACNPTGNIEFTLGGGRIVYADPAIGSNSDYVVQIKSLFRKLSRNDFGFGLAAGTVRHPAVNPGPNLLGNNYVYIPFSASFQDDALIVHVNYGWLREHETGKNLATWGAGTEFNLSNRITFISEIFGDSNPAIFTQVGGRFSLIPGLLQIDSTLGQRLDGADNKRWISFGIRLTPARMF